MTICIATLFTWNYAAMAEVPDLGLAALTTTDRMITAGDIEYEPPALKCCFLTRRVHILVARDYPTHSEAISSVQRALADEGPELDVGFIASLYSDALMQVRQREAVRRILTPIGLTLEDFTVRQNELASSQVSNLTSQLQRFVPPQTEAIIVGSDDVRAHIFMIDADGALSNQSDVGFAAIGMGAWHAKSQFMTHRYASQGDYAAALGISCLATKSAEIAPGVGKATDMHLITKNGWAAVAPDIFGELVAAFTEYDEKRIALVVTAVQKVRFHKPDPDTDSVGKHDGGADIASEN
jgi:hypothetical protein